MNHRNPSKGILFASFMWTLRAYVPAECEVKRSYNFLFQLLYDTQLTHCIQNFGSLLCLRLSYRWSSLFVLQKCELHLRTCGIKDFVFFSRCCQLLRAIFWRALDFSRPLTGCIQSLFPMCRPKIYLRHPLSPPLAARSLLRLADKY